MVSALESFVIIVGSILVLILIMLEGGFCLVELAINDKLPLS